MTPGFFILTNPDMHNPGKDIAAKSKTSGTS
jgi:hypothetical protein